MAEIVFLGGMIICFCWCCYDTANWIKERFIIEDVIQSKKCITLALVKFMMSLGSFFLFSIVKWHWL